MEKEILNNSCHLYKSHIVEFFLFFMLGVVAVLVCVGVLKFELLKSKVAQVTLIVFIVICAVTLLTIQILSTIPIYKDYKEMSYVVLEDASLTVVSDSTGIVNKTNEILVKDVFGQTHKMRMQSDLGLAKGDVYTGTVAYLPKSKYVVWYSFG